MLRDFDFTNKILRWRPTVGDTLVMTDKPICQLYSQIATPSRYNIIPVCDSFLPLSIGFKGMRTGWGFWNRVSAISWSRQSQLRITSPDWIYKILQILFKPDYERDELKIWDSKIHAKTWKIIIICLKKWRKSGQFGIFINLIFRIHDKGYELGY